MNFIYTLAALLLFTYQLPQDEICADLHQGVFTLEGSTTMYQVIRTEHEQIERWFDVKNPERDTQEVHFQILWVDDCTYLLINPPSGTYAGSVTYDTLTNVISDIKGNTHMVVSSYGDAEKTVRHLTRVR